MGRRHPVRRAAAAGDVWELGVQAGGAQQRQDVPLRLRLVHPRAVRASVLRAQRTLARVCVAHPAVPVFAGVGGRAGQSRAGRPVGDRARRRQPRPARPEAAGRPSHRGQRTGRHRRCSRKRWADLRQGELRRDAFTDEGANAYNADVLADDQRTLSASWRRSGISSWWAGPRWATRPSIGTGCTSATTKWLLEVARSIPMRARWSGCSSTRSDPAAGHAGLQMHAHSARSGPPPPASQPQTTARGR